MEMASFLSGEKWSDHPACTHPLLAGLARLVNDNVSDDRRARLVPLIPSVIGVVSDDLHVDVAIALRCASTALPIASAPRQNVLATAVLSCERLLAELDGCDRRSIREESRTVLDRVPEAEAWARSFTSGLRVSRRSFRSQTGPHILNLSVEGILLACVSDAQGRLIDLLETVIDETRELVLGTREPVPVPASWAPATATAGQRPGARLT